MTPISRKRRRKRIRKPINVLASAMTTLNLYFGIASIFASIDHKPERAAYYILIAIILDTLDGAVARLTRTTSEFGKELDSLCDIVSFGVAPSVMIYTAYLPEEPTNVTRLGAVLAIFFVICAALRLARFNVYQSDMRDFFIGLPSPAAAGTLASFVLFMQYFEWNDLMWYGLGPFTVMLAGLMVSSVPYPKSRMKAWVYGPRKGFSFLVLCGVAIAVIDQASHLSPSIVLFPLALLYLAAGPMEYVWAKATNRPLPDPLPGLFYTEERRPHTATADKDYPEAPGSSYTGDRL